MPNVWRKLDTRLQSADLRLDLLSQALQREVIPAECVAELSESVQGGGESCRTKPLLQPDAALDDQRLVTKGSGRASPSSTLTQNGASVLHFAYSVAIVSNSD
jgi:hypothetical protein